MSEKQHSVSAALNVDRESVISDLTNRLVEREQECYHLKDELDIFQARVVASEQRNEGQGVERGRQQSELKSSQAVEGALDEQNVQYARVEQGYEDKVDHLQRQVKSSLVHEETVRELQIRVQSLTRECLSQKAGKKYLQDIQDRTESNGTLRRREGILEMEEVHQVYQEQLESLREDLESRKEQYEGYRKEKALLLGDKTRAEEEQEVVRIRQEHMSRQAEEWKQRYELDYANRINEVNSLHEQAEQRFQEGVRVGQQLAQTGLHSEVEARANERYKAGQQDAIANFKTDFVEKEVYYELKQKYWEQEQHVREQETQKDVLGHMLESLRDEMEQVKKKVVLIERENTSLHHKQVIAQTEQQTEHKIAEYTHVPKPVSVRPEEFEYAVKWVYSEQYDDQHSLQDRCYRVCGLLSEQQQIREVEGRCRLFVDRAVACSKALRSGIDCFIVADKQARAISIKDQAWDMILQELARSNHVAKLACRQIERILDRIQALHRASVYEQRATVPGGRVVMSVAIEGDILSLQEVAETQIPLLQIRCEQNKQVVFLGIQGDWDQVKHVQNEQLSGQPSVHSNTNTNNTNNTNNNSTYSDSHSISNIIMLPQKTTSTRSTPQKKNINPNNSNNSNNSNNNTNMSSIKPITPKQTHSTSNASSKTNTPRNTSRNNSNTSERNLSPITSITSPSSSQSVISTLQSYADSQESKYLSTTPLSAASKSSSRSGSLQEERNQDILTYMQSEYEEEAAQAQFLTRANQAAGVDINITVQSQKQIPTDREADNTHAYWMGQSAHPLHHRAEPEYTYEYEEFE